MLRFFGIKLPQQVGHRASPLSRGNLFSTSSRKPSSKLSNSKDSPALTVSFLQNSCGLSVESAISASKKLNIGNAENPNSVLDLLRTHGLTRTHIRNLISSRPLLLLADLGSTLKPNIELFESLGFSGPSLSKMLSKEPRMLESDAYTTVNFFREHGFSDEQISTLTRKRPTLYTVNAQKIFEPKLEFLKSLGFSDSEMAKLLSAEPYILQRSLENHLIPCVQELRQILDTDENVLRAMKACYWLIDYDVEKVLRPNISMLMKHGVPRAMVLKIFLIEPKSLLLRSHRFSEVVSEVMKLGFDPNNILFVLAIRSMAVMSKTLWEQKLEAYRSFGLTKDEIYSAFRRQPMCMISSEMKIKKLLGFFVSKLKMTPSTISKNPFLLLLSLEKRIIPRCSVLHLLMLKGLIGENTSILNMFRISEQKFVDKVVSKYQNEVPDIIRAHQGKIEFEGFPFDLKMASQQLHLV